MMIRQHGNNQFFAARLAEWAFSLGAASVAEGMFREVWDQLLINVGGHW